MINVMMIYLSFIHVSIDSQRPVSRMSSYASGGSFDREMSIGITYLLQCRVIVLYGYKMRQLLYDGGMPFVTLYEESSRLSTLICQCMKLAVG